ncbi:MAG TPA: TonB-dependent receptor, partial [Pedobacter sp.]
MKSLQTPITFFIYLMLSLSVLTLTSAVKAQTQGSVAGKVSDDNQKPLDFATVSLLKAADSAFVKSSITDSTGSYLFEKVEAGNYLVKVTFSGYKKSTSKLLTVTPNNQTLVPVIVLNTDSKTLKEVSITVKKPFLERKADKLILNVEGSAVAVGNTALEVLQKAPGVTLDKDDNLSMSGKSSVLVMLDGKPTYMSNADLANMLRSMQSTQIETIELITNPSAKYDAAGNGGIINIKTKRNRKLGFNGSTTIGSGYGQTTKYNGSTNLNFRKGKINLFGSYNYSNNGNRNIFELNRKVTDENAITNFDQDNNWNSRRNNNGYKVGV